MVIEFKIICQEFLRTPINPKLKTKEKKITKNRKNRTSENLDLMKILGYAKFHVGQAILSHFFGT